MKARFAVVFFALPLAAWAGGCSGASGSGGLSCPADPQCYVVSAGGECSVDLGATCPGGTWQCSADGKLGSGCYPDGGIVPPDDAGACPLAQLNPPLACNDDATCTPYGGHCVFDALNGPGTCVYGLSAAAGRRCRLRRLRSRLLRRLLRPTVVHRRLQRTGRHDDLFAVCRRVRRRPCGPESAVRVPVRGDRSAAQRSVTSLTRRAVRRLQPPPTGRGRRP